MTGGQAAGTSAPRVLILITDTRRGGTPLQMARIAREIRSRGWTVMLVGMLPPGPVAAELEAAGVRTESLGVRTKLGSWFALRRLRLVMRKFRPDVVQTALFHANLIGRMAAMGSRVPVVNGHVSIDDDRTWGRTLVDRATHRLANWHTAVSASVADRVATRDGVPRERIAVIHRGADVPSVADRRRQSRQDLGIPAEARVVAWTGRLDPAKDLRTLVDAVAHLPAQWWLVLAGDGAQRAAVESWCRDAGLGNRVRLTGELADVQPVLEAADVFVLTSRWEGFPGAALEAMAAGLPVVATAVGGVPEMIEHDHDGLLVAPGDSTQIAAAVVEAADRPELGVRARETVHERFNVAGQVDAYDALWRGLVRPASAHADRISPPAARRRGRRDAEELRILVLAPYPLGTAPSQRFRFEQYVEPLAERGIQLDVSSFLDHEAMRVIYTAGHVADKARAVLQGIRRRRHDLQAARGYDLAFVHREAWPIGYSLIEHRLTRMRLPYVFDFDDSIYLPNFSPANRLVAPLKRGSKTRDAVRRARLVTAGNQHLAAWARQYSSSVRVIPTTIDTQLYRPHPPASRDRLCIGWSGSVTTIDHLRVLAPLLRELQQERGVALRVIGDPSFRIEGAEVEALPWREETELEDLSRIDIGVMPLPDDDWGQGKCGLKALQYMALGIPTLMSPVGVNRTIARDGAALLASTPGEWASALRSLIADAELRLRLAEAGRRRVEESYSTEANIDAYSDALRSAAAVTT